MKNALAFLSILMTTLSSHLLSSPSTNPPLSIKEPFMKPYTVVRRPSMTIIGIQCRTSNAKEAGPIDIPKLWQQFYTEEFLSKIPNKTSNEIVALYCDYEGDFTKPYSLVIGAPVSSLETIPETMVAKVIPGMSYALFSAKGTFPQSLVETWGKVWTEPLNRTYSGDFELYGDKSPEEVEIYIAIQD